MIGVGIDLGFSSTKGIAIRVLEDGHISLLEAVLIPSAEVTTRAGELASALARHRPSRFTRPPLSLCVSHPDIFFDRVRLPLTTETGDVTEEEIRGWLAEGKILPPTATKMKEDLWDFQVLRLFRRATDLEQLGKKYAVGLFARIPRAVADSVPVFKPLPVKGLEPSVLAALNACLQLTPPAKGQPTLFMNLGLHQVQAVLLADREVLRVAIAPLGDFTDIVEKLARLEPGKAGQRIQNADLTATDAVSVAIKDVVSKVLKKIQAMVGGEDETSIPRPQQILLCGGLASVKGMSRFVNSTLNIQTDTLVQPERLQSTLALPAPYPIFAGAMGAALRSAGAVPLPLMPRKQLPRAARAQPAPAPVAAGQPVAARAPTAPVPAWAGAFRDLPERLGWGWVAIGAVALVASLLILWYPNWPGGESGKKRRELALLTVEMDELKRQDGLIKQYVSLTGSGGLLLFPWGAVITEMASKMPRGTYLTTINANQERLLVGGRVKGSPSRQVKRIVEGLKKAPMMKRLGLTPPEL